MGTEIHPSSIVEPGAELGENVNIGPFCIVGKNARLGDGTVLKSHVSIEGRTEMGANCIVFPFTTIGHEPQDTRYKGEDTGVKIGDNNTFRESVTVHRGSVDGNGTTEIGSDNFWMAYSHVAHDCKVGNHIIAANAVTLGGHVVVEDRVFLGGFTAVHQHSMIGTYAMTGGVSRITKDIPPYVIAVGVDKLKLYGLNSVGLKRGGMPDEAIKELKAAYKILFGKKGSLKEAVKKVQEELEYTDEIKHLLEFITSTKRTICR